VRRVHSHAKKLALKRKAELGWYDKSVLFHARISPSFVGTGVNRKKAALA
jgi:hypothetical protein